MAFLGSFGEFLGGGLKGLSRVAGAIPGVGTAIGTGMGGLGELLQKGSKTNLGGFLGSSAGGALSGLIGAGAGKLSSLLGLGGGGGGIGGALGGFLGSGGGGLGKLLGLGGGVLTAKMLKDQYEEAQADKKMARQLAGESLESYRNAVSGAQDRYNMNSPLRDAFRMGALSFSDPSNPFSRDLFATQRGQLQMETNQQKRDGKQQGGRKAKPRQEPTNRQSTTKGGLRYRTGLDRRRPWDEDDRVFEMRAE